MKLRKKKLLAVLLVLVLTVSILSGCTNTTNSDKNSETNTTSEPKSNAPIQITDTADRSVEITGEVNKIIALNSSCYTMIKALGQEDKIFGVTDSVIDAVPSAREQNLKTYGAYDNPNIEEIIADKPDLVIGYTYTDANIITKLEEADIKVALLEFYIPSLVVEETTKLGKILRAEDKATEVTNYINTCTNTIEEKLKGINDSDKKTVYWEGYSDYNTVSKGSGGDEIIEFAHGINIAGNEEAKYPKVSDEWVLEKNPDVIVKLVSSSSGIMGEGFTDETPIKELYQSMISRSGWSDLAAVKDDKLILLSSNIGTTADGYFIGALYMAKLMYPEELKDVDPYEMYAGFQEKFLSTDVDGIIAYIDNKVN
ncbi:ABC transporter substrate-binding protein [Alkalibaculum bacchi]|uniref:ABC transporter substrate-binding protein n=1 Tax=Alkalibaculum bacchi TaxID=645887 RepID=UPI0026EFCBAA|nr:ABC transporter substrate-binding protein [Alkalibaculum bacchi]